MRFIKGVDDTKSKNKFYENPDHMVGVTKNGDRFLFSKEDLCKVMDHTWCLKKSSNGIPYVVTRLIVNETLKTGYLHRLIMEPGYDMEVDHINHNVLDNRRENLRLCTREQNLMNRRKNKKSSSQFKGVSFYRPLNKWKAQIKINHKKIHIGYFENEIDAAKAYNKAAILYFGDFAYLNNIA